jgi:hypothetical protein
LSVCINPSSKCWGIERSREVKEERSALRCAEMSRDLPHVQASAPRPVRSLLGLSHVRKTLNPGIPVLPVLPTSLDVVGQWLMCCAGASPTEDPQRQSIQTAYFLYSCAVLYLSSNSSENSCEMFKMLKTSLRSLWKAGETGDAAFWPNGPAGRWPGEAHGVVVLSIKRLPSPAAVKRII